MGEEEAEALIGREGARERRQLQAEMELQFSKFTRLGFFIAMFAMFGIVIGTLIIIVLLCNHLI